MQVVSYDSPRMFVCVICRQNKDKHFNEDVNDIMIIPDLDEDGGGDSDARGTSSCYLLLNGTFLTTTSWFGYSF